MSAGKHPDRALTAVKVRQVVTPGRYADGNGLYLVVDPSGAKRWLLRIVVQGRRRDIGLGSVRLVPLVEAREKALAYRKSAREGNDPLAERAAAKIVAPTFEVAARQVHEANLASWRNPKHAAQWLSTLTTYAFPTLGNMRVDVIGTPDVLRVLSPIWLARPETARRVRQRIGSVMDFAKAAGFRTSDNPIESVARGLPNQIDRDKHHSAMPYVDLPLFIKTLRQSPTGELTSLALEFLILTAARTGEVIGARWPEIDEKSQTWTVPAERMKAGREHRVPLTDRAMAILKQARLLTADGSPYLFPGRRTDRPMSNMAFLMHLRRANLSYTAHGFRSSFRDWAAEATNFPREVAESALAHTLANKVEAAYRRSDLFDKRRELMDAWTRYLEVWTDGATPP